MPGRTANFMKNLLTQVISGLNRIAQIYAVNKDHLFHRINQFLIGLSVLIITIIYAVNSGGIESFEDRVIWPLDIVKVANEQLGLHYDRPHISHKVNSPPQPKNSFHLLVVDLTTADWNLTDSVGISNLDAFLDPIIPHSISLHRKEISLSEKLIFYYLWRSQQVYGLENMLTLFYTGGKKNNEYEKENWLGGEKGMSFSQLITPLVTLCTAPNNGVSNTTISSFSEIFEKIDNLLEHDTDILNQEQITLTIISDFDHDFSKKSFVQVQEKIEAVANTNLVNQFNMVQLPVRNSTEEASQRANRLVKNIYKCFPNTFLLPLEIDQGISPERYARRITQDIIYELDFLIAPIHINRRQKINAYSPYAFGNNVSTAVSQVQLEHLGKSSNEDITTGFFHYHKSRYLQDYQVFFSSKQSNSYTSFPSSFAFELPTGRLKEQSQEFLMYILTTSQNNIDAGTIEFMYFPFEREKVKDGKLIINNYLGSKTVIPMSFIKRLSVVEAILLGVFALTFISGLIAYGIVIILSVFKDKLLKLSPFILILFVSGVLCLLLIYFSNYFLFQTGSLAAGLLLVIPFCPALSILFWYALYKSQES